VARKDLAAYTEEFPSGKYIRDVQKMANDTRANLEIYPLLAN
jgi:hypothetical protein